MASLNTVSMYYTACSTRTILFMSKKDVVQFYFEIIMPAFDTAMKVDESWKNMRDDYQNTWIQRRNGPPSVQSISLKPL